MAWLDERIWCHPKFTDISNEAFRAYVNGVAYSAGFSCKGVLTPGQQRTIGSDDTVRDELVAASLWELVDGGVYIHDWDEHNGKRDERRAKDRERKKASRAASSGTSAGLSSGASTGSARVDGSEGSEEIPDRPVLIDGGGPERLVSLPARNAAELLLAQIKPEHRDEGTRMVVLAYSSELEEADFVSVARELQSSRDRIRNEAKWVNGALGRRARRRAALTEAGAA